MFRTKICTLFSSPSLWISWIASCFGVRTSAVLCSPYVPKSMKIVLAVTHRLYIPKPQPNCILCFCFGSTPWSTTWVEATAAEKLLSNWTKISNVWYFHSVYYSVLQSTLWNLITNCMLEEKPQGEKGGRKNINSSSLPLKKKKDRKKNIEETLLPKIGHLLSWKFSQARFSHHGIIQENALPFLLSFPLPPSKT